MTAGLLLLGVVTLGRLVELAISRRNTARLLAAGAVEAAPAHYPLIVAMHAAWLAGLWVLAWDRPVAAGWLAVFLALQVLRVWTLAGLDPRWTTRIVVLPGLPLVRRGPYRWVAHPNYAIVVAEIAVLPLVFGLVRYAVLFSILNAAVLAVRIRAEAAALRAAEVVVTR